jgi:hypothetical protein
MADPSTKPNESRSLEKTEEAVPEQGNVQVQPTPGPAPNIILQNMFPSGKEELILIGEIKEKVSNVQERLERIEKKLDEVVGRVEKLESLPNVIEAILPEKIAKMLKDYKLVKNK